MELYHYGIKEQRWGIRRFQNRDGSRTPEGAKREADKRHTKRAEHYRQLTKELAKEGKTLQDYRKEIRSTRKALRFKQAIKDDKMSMNEISKKFGKNYVKKQLENPDFAKERMDLMKSLLDDAEYEEYYENGGDIGE